MRLLRYAEYKDSGTSWLGNVPAHWQVRRLGSFFYERRQKVSDRDYPALSVTKSGIVPQLETAAKTDDGDNRKLVRAGDFVINSRSDRKGSAGTARLDGSVSLISTVLRPTSDINIEFAHHLLRSTLFQEEFYRFGKGIVADLWSTSYSEMRNIMLALPDLEGQAAIAAFLDREIVKIDALIAEQEKLIALLAEKRQATISHAVTKGLNPNAPMKHSGVLWLGEVPTHWAIKRVKHLVKEGIAGPYGSSLTKSMYSASGYRVYGQQQVIPGDFSVGDYYISEEQFAEMSRYQVRPNDVLISVMGTIGRSAVVPQDAEAGIINPRLVLYRVIERLICPKYLQTFLNNPTSQRYFSLAAQGTTMEGLNMGSIGELHVALPPLHEQQEILQFVQSEGAKLDALSVESDRAVSLFKERRSALIAAAVTGQIGVRGEVAEVAA
ncbi:restriction endonuclease subunit S [Xanthomonas campestris pv. raphani]|uniref:restriction endonuclease subunit S n=1 Tax=Xanthomonas campestris TaxID=339 RepID=UPI001E41E3FA|nr:restriction endonuclease subunit S [Xanthomonas campestris]MCC8686693.1 restriction endonuclease subunit S [Xanthomonas campestris]MCW2001247.1 type I restriction enzyme S subunit [Xanthomonas campestris]MEA9681011.1 restriction endonuclease subunit S [Xanthomonas campestris pv. raphani]MEA9700964.1 restriction endonuclease subunit S [Xanthomonas campestris pv. raphani]MEA9781466.1 restriction endonuclease subunit S [Xanthomonas campestris pv. raphani]